MDKTAYTLNQLNHFLTVLLRLALLKGSSKIISNFMDIFFHWVQHS